MTYVCEISSNQRVYLENQGEQTLVTSVSSSAGQQQQASCGFQTGSWSEQPEVLKTPEGVILKIKTAQGETYVKIQGTSIGMMSGSPNLGSSQQVQLQQTTDTPNTKPMQPMQPMQPMEPMEPMKPMEPMEPMEPMKPMEMGDMEMKMNPMEMRMGNMNMSMGSGFNATNNPTKRFCSQCGAAITASDRFCSSCGHRLQ